MLPASWKAVDHLPAVVTKGRAVGAVRILLLTLAAAGFLAMHGMAATDPAGLHHSPMMPATSMADPHRSTGPGDGTASAQAACPDTAPTCSHGGASDGHDVMVACLFVLLGFVAGVALQLLRGGLGSTTPVPPGSLWDGRSPPRAPPRPIFLSLCVFRL